MSMRRRRHPEATLRESPVFARVSDADLVRIDRLATGIDVPVGRVLMVEGGIGREVLIVVEGEATVSVAGDVVGVAGPGDVVGEAAILDGRRRAATVTATTPMRILVFDPTAFLQVLDVRPVMLHLIEALADRRSPSPRD